MGLLRATASLAAALAAASFSLRAVAANDAAFVEQSVPATVLQGASFGVDLTMQNTGDTTWAAAEGYFLGSQNPQDNTTWGTNRIAMDASASVAPGATVVLHGTLTAPGQPGDYPFQWQMLQDAVEWFGDTTPVLTIHVTAEPELSCDGTEKLCLTLKELTAIQATGATVSGDVNGEGFLPADQGGIDWHWLPADGLCSGRLEVDVKGLLPQSDASQPEQVSVFETCGEGADSNQVIGLQRMMLGYHGNNIFRYYATTDFNQFGWQLGLWTDGFEATDWTAGQTHHFVVEWTSGESGNAAGALEIDGQKWSASGTCPFNPANQVFTLGNRCPHFPTQQAVARFSNLRVWARGGCQDAPAVDAGVDAEIDAAPGPDAAGDAEKDGAGQAPESGTAGQSGAGGTKGGAGAGGRAQSWGGESGGDGCACRASARGGSGSGGIAAVILAGLAVARRRR